MESHDGTRRTTSKLARLLELIVLLHGGPSFSVEELSLTLGVSRRTLFRYLNILAEASVPFYYDQVLRGYRIRSDFFLATPRLTAEEVAALCDGVEHAIREATHPKARAFAIAWSKVKAQLPPAHRNGQRDSQRGGGQRMIGSSQAASSRRERKPSIARSSARR